MLRAGDTLVVRWVDRLGRNYTDVVDTIREFMRRGIIIKTVINGMTFDGSATDPMRQAVRDPLIAFMAATACPSRGNQVRATRRYQPASPPRLPKPSLLSAISVARLAPQPLWRPRTPSVVVISPQTAAVEPELGVARQPDAAAPSFFIDAGHEKGPARTGPLQPPIWKSVVVAAADHSAAALVGWGSAPPRACLSDW
jgi:hypothetical protein